MANNKHSVKAVLYPNMLTNNQNDFTARVLNEKSLNISDICDSAVSRGGATTTAEAMNHNVSLFFKEMAYQLCDGFSINTGYFHATPQIRGVFTSPIEQFNPDKHKLLFQFNQGELMRELIDNVEVDVTGLGDSSITILEVTDVKTGSINKVITPNRNLKIKGIKIKVVGEVADNGVYFINEATEVSTKVDMSDIVTNNPSELIIVIPDLPAGNYKLKVTSQFSGSTTPLIQPRTFVFSKTLIVY